MNKIELLSAALFIAFWVYIYSFEFKCLFLYFKRKPVPKAMFTSIVHFFAVLGLVCLAYAYFIEPYWVDVSHIYINNDKIPEEQSPLTIVQISDMHCDPKIRAETKLVKMINELKPDIIVFTGDSINSIEGLPVFKKTLTSLKANMGKFAVRGNFGVWYWGRVDLFGGTGFVELDCEEVPLEKNNMKFTISGIGVESLKDSSFIYSLPEDTYNVLLYHYPGINEELEDNNVDLFLAGHTHGGQLALPFYGAIVTLSKYSKKYERGRYDIGDKVLYVNRGVGMEGGTAPRIRFCSRPEITVFHITGVGAQHQNIR